MSYDKRLWLSLQYRSNFLTFFQLSSLIARGGVGADNLQFKLESNPRG